MLGGWVSFLVSLFYFCVSPVIRMWWRIIVRCFLISLGVVPRYWAMWVVLGLLVPYFLVYCGGLVGSYRMSSMGLVCSGSCSLMVWMVCWSMGGVFLFWGWFSGMGFVCMWVFVVWVMVMRGCCGVCGVIWMPSSVSVMVVCFLWVWLSWWSLVMSSGG